MLFYIVYLMADGTFSYLCDGAHPLPMPFKLASATVEAHWERPGTRRYRQAPPGCVAVAITPAERSDPPQPGEY